MGDHRLPKWIISRVLENAGHHGPGGNAKDWTDCIVEHRRLFGITWNSSTVAPDPRAWYKYNTLYKRSCTFMAAWAKAKENASKNQKPVLTVLYSKRKREVEDADKVAVAPGVTSGSFGRFRVALIGPIQGLPKRRCYGLQMRGTVNSSVNSSVNSCDPGGGRIECCLLYLSRGWRYTRTNRLPIYPL